MASSKGAKQPSLIIGIFKRCKRNKNKLHVTLKIAVTFQKHEAFARVHWLPVWMPGH